MNSLIKARLTEPVAVADVQTLLAQTQQAVAQALAVITGQQSPGTGSADAFTKRVDELAKTMPKVDALKQAREEDPTGYQAYLQAAVVEAKAFGAVDRYAAKIQASQQPGESFTAAADRIAHSEPQGYLEYRAALSLGKKESSSSNDFLAQAKAAEIERRSNLIDPVEAFERMARGNPEAYEEYRRSVVR